MELDNNEESKKGLFTQRGIDLAIKLGALLLVLLICFNILAPFILPMAWGAILSVALYPLFVKFSKVLGSRDKLAASIIVIISIALVVAPTIEFTNSAVDSAQKVSTQFKEGTFEIPNADERIKSWPLVGEDLYNAWDEASTNLEHFAQKYTEEIKNITAQVFSAAANFGGVLAQFILSVIISAIFLVNTKSCHQGCIKVAQRLMDENGPKAIETSVATIRSVAVGILGIALIQALLGGVGLLFAGIPAAGVWVLLILIVATIQLPPILILGPIAAYYFSVADTTPAVIFLIWSILVSSSDAVLKPLFLGRGMETPMIVILLGAIGGMITYGIIGLFLGAVFLALGFELLSYWLHSNTPEVTENEESHSLESSIKK